MAFLERAATADGAVIAYGCEVVGISRVPSGYRVEYRESAGATSIVESTCVVNSAGLGAQRVAGLAGIDCAAARYTLHACKGEYFRVSNRHKGRLKRLVYPVPTPTHLGAHAVLALDGSLRIGPSSFYVDQLDYAVDPAHRDDFHAKASRFLPFIEPDDLTPDQSGIRPKIQPPGEPMRDFVIREESDRGLPGFVNLIGMESPGLTSCLTIAETVAGLL
jgi:L-2-hydroxyglutarate oxidase LhgO